MEQLLTGFTNQELLYLFTWSLIGSILGYFSFTYSVKLLKSIAVFRGIRSAFVGVFLAIPCAYYLQESGLFSVPMSIFLGGMCAFLIPDCVFNWYKKIQTILFSLVLSKFNKSDNTINLSKDRK